jgi:hypothetical protein
MIASTERLNPVLVKEVRQSLRGKLFRVIFVLNLSVAALAAVLSLQGYADTNRAAPGREIFLVLHGIYAGCVFLLVPLMANRGMAAERDEETFDALIISGLAARQIVLGKWLASGVLMLLFLSASAPFLALGFALHGLDLLTSVALVFITSLAGLGLCLVGLLFATLVKNRALDTVMLGVQLVAAVMLFMMWLFFSEEWMRGEFFRAVAMSDFFVGAVAWLVFGCVVFRWMYCLTVARLSHPEENASTGLRVATLALTFVMLVGCVLVYFLGVRSAGMLHGSIMAAVVVLSVACLGIITERDALGRRSVEDLHTGRWRWPLSWMFLPGGGRGYAFYLAQLALFAALALLPIFVPGGTTREYTTGVLLVILTLVAFTGFPSRLAGDARCTPRARFSIRVCMPLLPFVLIVVALIAGLLTGDRDLINGNHALNPFWAIGEAMEHESGALWGFAIYGTMAVLSVLMNVPRMLRGRREVMALRRGGRVAVAGGAVVAAGSPASDGVSVQSAAQVSGAAPVPGDVPAPGAAPVPPVDDAVDAPRDG